MRSTVRRAAAVIAGVAIASAGAATAGGSTGRSATAAQPKVAGLPSTAGRAGGTCYGQTDNPHNSRHFPGDVSVSSRTFCPGEAVTVTISLYKRVHGAWRLLATGRNSGAGRTQANAHGRCGRHGTTYRFLGVAYHTATNHSPAITRNANRVTCR